VPKQLGAGAALEHDRVTGRSIALFIAAALAEIGGAYLVWVGLRDDKGPLVVALGSPLWASAAPRTASPVSR
jgi:hypothetical protein